MFTLMVSELIPRNAHDLLPFLLMTVNLSLMMVVVRTRKKMGRRTSLTLGLVSTGAAALVTLSAFPEYHLDPTHISSHIVFSTTILLYGKLIVSEDVPAILDRLILFELNTFDKAQYSLAQTMMSIFDRIRDSLELNVFDGFQYAFAKRVVSVASGARRVHTGDLNLNMVWFLVGFVICLLFLLRFAFF